jgi:hypothetical protein
MSQGRCTGMFPTRRRHRREVNGRSDRWRRVVARHDGADVLQRLDPPCDSDDVAGDVGEAVQPITGRQIWRKQRGREMRPRRAPARPIDLTVHLAANGQREVPQVPRRGTCKCVRAGSACEVQREWAARRVFRGACAAGERRRSRAGGCWRPKVRRCARRARCTAARVCVCHGDDRGRAGRV